MKTLELSGTALNWAVAKCEGVINGDALDVGFIREGGYTPSSEWAQGGPIIEREGVSIDAHLDREEWIARNYWGMHEQQGATPLIAAMRCYVASKLGNDVQLPEELK